MKGNRRASPAGRQGSQGPRTLGASQSEKPLSRWFKIMRQTQFGSFTALRHTFPSADKVGEFVVFNIAGNKYRLIVSIHFNRGKVYIRRVLTHQAYDRGGWRT